MKDEKCGLGEYVHIMRESDSLALFHSFLAASQ